MTTCSARRRNCAWCMANWSSNALAGTSRRMLSASAISPGSGMPIARLPSTILARGWAARRIFLPLPQTMGYTGPGWRENECRQSCPSDKCLVCDELDFGCDGDCGSCPTFEERVEIRWVTKERTLINLAGHIPNCSLVYLENPRPMGGVSVRWLCL